MDTIFKTKKKTRNNTTGCVKLFDCHHRQVTVTTLPVLPLSNW